MKPKRYSKHAASKKPTKSAIVIGAILLITFIAFSPALTHEFTNWDDPKYLLDNSLVKELSKDNIVKIFQIDKPQEQRSHVPLTLLTFALEYHFFGLNPAVYHFNNILLHLLNTTLVFLLIFRIVKAVEFHKLPHPSGYSKELVIAGITSLLFGIHPLHVESVAWITERKDTLCAFFYMLTLIVYVRYCLRKKNKAGHYILALFLFGFALLSKSMAVSLPLILMLIDYLFSRKFSFKVILEKVPFFILSLVWGIVTVITVKKVTESDGQHGDIAFITFDTILYAFYGIAHYLYKVFTPVMLSCFYPYPEMENNNLPVIFYINPFIVLFIAYLVFRTKKQTKAYVFGSLFFLFAVMPVLQLLPVGDNLVTDRYTYLPYTGLLFIIGYGGSYVYEKYAGYRSVMKIGSGVIILILTVICYQRVKIWENSNTLWTDVIQKYPKEHTGYNNRGIYFLDNNEKEKALVDFTKAIELDPEYYDALNNRGNLYRQSGRFELAIQDYKKAIVLKPANALAHNNIGNAWFSMNKYDMALEEYNKALELNPNHDKAHGNRGAIYTKQGKIDLALQDFKIALQLNPDYEDAYLNRAVLFSITEQYEAALADYTRYLAYVQNNINAWNWRGSIFQKAGRHNEAIQDFSKALQLNPNVAIFYYNRSESWKALGNEEQSRIDALQAQKLGFAGNSPI